CDQTARTQAQAKQRSFRALSCSRTWSSITRGSLQVSHCCSIIPTSPVALVRDPGRILPYLLKSPQAGIGPVMRVLVYEHLCCLATAEVSLRAEGQAMLW